MTGIYKITNLDNGKMYVGQAVDIEERWHKHKYKLNNHKHENNHLQSSWDIHGENRFMFSVLEECTVDQLDDLEIYWIGELKTYTGFKDNNGYNQNLGGHGNKKITIDDVREICEMYNNGMSIKDIANKTGRKYRRVRDYLKIGAYNKLCDYNPKAEKSKSHSTMVICLNNNQIFNSIRSAQEYYNISSISDCCRGKCKYAGRDENGEYLLWMYYSDYLELSNDEIEEIKNRLNYEIHSDYVVCINNYNIYESAKYAARQYGIKPYLIYECCDGKRPYGGFDASTGQNLIWMHYNDFIRLTDKEIQIMLQNNND